jgi:hypothetical protein
MTEHHTERQTEKTTNEARAGVTGQGVRYVLALSLTGAIIVLCSNVVLLVCLRLHKSESRRSRMFAFASACLLG